MKKEIKEKKVIELDLLNTEGSGALELALVESPAIESLWMAFKEVKLVKPKAGENEQDFVSRCIGVLVGDEGYEQDQAAAICYSTFEEKMAEMNLYYEGEDVFRLSDEDLALALEPNPCWEGYEPYGLKDDGTPNCIPIKAKEMKLAESYTDYPEGAVSNAKRALEWADKNGWGDCGMGPGKARANQLANREPISEDTIARMSAFERHRQNSETPYSEGCGKLMWDAWGGDAGIRWAKNKLEEIRNTELSYDTSGLPTYVDEIAKPISKAVKLAEESYSTIEEAVKRSKELGLKGEIHSHQEGDGFIYMPGASHDDLEKALASKEELAAPASGNKGDRPLARIPKEERGRTGSAKNKPGDTKTTRGGIEVSEEVESSLKDKIKEHNEKNPQDTQKATLGMLKSVWRRGAGAYSVGTPGKRGMARAQWAMARVNSFLNILAGNKSGYDKDYNQDNDLLPKGHPKHSEQKMSKFYFASEDERIIVGPVIIPNKEIPRIDEDKQVYYIKYSPETVKKMAEKFLKEKRTDSTNIEHDPDVNGKTYIFESWIVENEEDKANTIYNLDVPVGTWCVKARVTDDKIWQDVKSGKLKGWSLEGNFVDKEELDAFNRDKNLYEKIVNMLKSID